MLWINPAVGVAGDMLLGALLDVGADEDVVREHLAVLPLTGWDLVVGRTTRRGLTATAVDVGFGTDHHRSWSSIDVMLGDADLPALVRDGARDTFRRLGEAESAVHGIDIDDVHFHEVGAVDAIIDIVGAWTALHSLGMPTVVAAPIGLGTGTARMAHGTVPVPAPATLELLSGAPTVPVDVTGETATPTGVALVVSMAASWGHLPAGSVVRAGRGAGAWDPDSHANVVTVVLTEAGVADPVPDENANAIDAPVQNEVDAAVAAPVQDVAVVSDAAGTDAEPARVAAALIETNLDDVTPEVLGHLISLLLDAGADDAWVVPVTMKKGRPGHQLRLLCRPERATELRRIVAAETGTLGMRQWTVDKYELERSMTEVLVDGHVVRVKVGPSGAKPEFDDVVAVAAATGRTFRQVAHEALIAWSDASAAHGGPS